MGAKTVYTDGVVSALVDAYTSAATADSRAKVIADFADRLGVSDRSVRAKLVSLGVYVKAAKAAAKGSKVRKADIAAAIASKLGADVAKDLTGLTKSTLGILADALDVDTPSD